MGGVSTGARGWIRCWYWRTRRARRESEEEVVVVMVEDWAMKVWSERRAASWLLVEFVA